MLNADDALGLQEDLAILRNNQRRHHAAALMVEEADLAVAQARVLDRAVAELQQVRMELERVKSNRNDINAVATATREALHLVMERLARATNQPIDDIRGIVLRNLSRRYDTLVNESISRGTIVADTRKDPAVMKRRDWYIAP